MVVGKFNFHHVVDESMKIMFGPGAGSITVLLWNEIRLSPWRFMPAEINDE